MLSLRTAAGHGSWVDDSWHPCRVVDPKAQAAAEQQVVLHLLHELARGPVRDQDPDQAGPDPPLWRDRKAAEIGVERLELGSRLACALAIGLEAKAPSMAHFTNCRILLGG